MKYKYLDQINFPNDLRKFSTKDLKFIAKDDLEKEGYDKFLELFL